MQKISFILTISLLLSCGGHLFAQKGACEKVIERGQAAYNAGKYEEAMKVFKGALKISCPDAQKWIDKCQKKIAERKNANQSTGTSSNRNQKQILCDELWKYGKEAYDNGNYEAALDFFKGGLEHGCTNANWQSYIERCNTKIVEQGKMHLSTTPSNSISTKEIPSLDLTEIRRAINLNASSYSTDSFSNGVYKGQKQNGQRHGLGIYYWTDGSVYIGAFSKGYRSGVGIYCVAADYEIPNCSDCSFYIGQWYMDKKQGMGNCYGEKGELLYHGDFMNNMPTGNYPSKDDYSSLGFNKLEGENMYYLGEIKNRKPNGIGIYIWKDSGNIWYGEWANGVRAGYGIEIKKNGEMTTGYWNGDSYRN